MAQADPADHAHGAGGHRAEERHQREGGEVQAAGGFEAGEEFRGIDVEERRAGGEKQEKPNEGVAGANQQKAAVGERSRERRSTLKRRFCTNLKS